MDGHRKLLILATNELLKRKLISLDGTEESHGHVISEISGEISAINWDGIGHQEVRISIWWKYDHSLHPQADLSGDARERFQTSLPLAKQHHLQRFVGVTVSGWLERKTGKHLQGRDRERLFDIYTRHGEREILAALPEPLPNGFGAEGPFFL